MNFISALFGAIGSVFNWVVGRDAIKNTAPLQQAAAAKKEQSQLDQTTKAVATQNTKELRDELSE